MYDDVVEVQRTSWLFRAESAAAAAHTNPVNSSYSEDHDRYARISDIKRAPSLKPAALAAEHSVVTNVKVTDSGKYVGYQYVPWQLHARKEVSSYH